MKKFYLDEWGNPKPIKIGMTIFIAVLLFATICLSFTTVNSGEVGLKVRFGKITNEVATEGINFKIPYIDEIVKVNIKVQKSEVDSTAASKDLQDIYIKFAVNYQVKAEYAYELYKTVGNNYEEVILQPAIQESIKSVTAGYTAEEMITKRGEISQKTLDLLQNKTAKYGLKINELNIINLDFSEEFNKAIEEKQIAEQKVRKAEQELEQTKIEAEKKVTEAQAEAEALKLQKEEITSELLELRKIEAQLKAIEKWNGQLPNYNLGNTIPFIDVK